MELLMLREKFQVTNVPYRGAAPALADLVAGQVQAKLDNYTQSAPFIADRKLAVLAVTSARRLKQLPEVPTVAEQLPGFEAYLWMGIVAPAATPDAVVEKLATAIRRFVALPETQARFDKDGVEPVGSGPDEFSTQIAREIAQWRELAKTTKITVD
jgi:tripartite-type tricarboxylate transporter receptor subunit TctC